MDFGLGNKTFVITGSSRGIGKAIAKGFLTEGANVVLVARDAQQLTQTANELLPYAVGNRLVCIPADCTLESDMHSLRERTMTEFGQIDGLVLNVGSGTSTNDAIANQDHWDKVWDVNFHTAIHPARIFMKDLQQSGGCMLFISSIAGIESIGAPTDYSAAKTALLSLSKSLSKKLAPKVRVNALCPGNVLFEGGTWEKKIQNNPDGITRLIKENVPLERFGTPEEIADAACFLCSSRATFITGSVLIVDGGQTKTLF